MIVEQVLSCSSSRDMRHLSIEDEERVMMGEMAGIVKLRYISTFRYERDK